MEAVGLGTGMGGVAEFKLVVVVVVAVVVDFTFSAESLAGFLLLRIGGVCAVVDVVEDDAFKTVDCKK